MSSSSHPALGALSRNPEPTLTTPRT